VIVARTTSTVEDRKQGTENQTKCAWEKGKKLRQNMKDKTYRNFKCRKESDQIYEFKKISLFNKRRKLCISQQ
jgi:hypothetical protein